MSENKEFCPTCTQSIFCPTWAEWRCRAFERRVYNYDKLTECQFYKKRGKDFKEPRCRCEDCLKNDLLAEEYGDK